jgi:UPF0755 protein
MRRFFIVVTLLLIIIALVIILAISVFAKSKYGEASSALGSYQRLSYATKILWHDSSIKRAADPYGIEQNFNVEIGESPYQIAARLEEENLILDDEAFLTLLIYTGMDTHLMPGNYRLSPSLSMQSIAGMLQDTRASQIIFVVLPGWRMEEIAASLPTSGLFIAEESFLEAAGSPPPLVFSEGDARDATSSEGFFFPDSYLLSRNLTADQLISELTLNFARNLTPEIKAGFATQGLTVYDAVKLASIVQREAVVADERAMIASVFLNRLRASQKLETDPTIQYALGYDEISQNWWKAPLTYADLEVISPYNTYLHAGLPPTPICNPSLGSLESVAFPAETPYFYFRASCDGSGLHAFAETFEGHLANGCE